MTSSWVPDRGDLVWLDFDPQAGREQPEDALLWCYRRSGITPVLDCH